MGRALWHHDGILRRQYQSRYSNAIWHIDGLHKLILWGYVIHGTIDGHGHMAHSELNYLFCPGLHVSKVTGLRASTNNHASTVLALFQEPIKAHGCPSCVRGDLGGGKYCCCCPDDHVSGSRLRFIPLGIVSPFLTG